MLRSVSRPILLAMLLLSAFRAECQGVQAGAKTLTAPGYDVISVKPDKSGSGSMHIDSYETTFDAQNISIGMLMKDAFGIRENLISGLPDWAKSSRWDIRAKVVDPDPTLKDVRHSREERQAAYRAKVQSILTERFHLKVHSTTEVQPIYDLVVAKGGSKLNPADPEAKNRGDMGIHNQVLTATGVPVSALLLVLSGECHRDVVDKTGLSGEFNMSLRWSREDQSVNGTDNGTADRPPILFIALEEQMGLKLVPDKGPVAALVVDAIEMPSTD